MTSLVAEVLADAPAGYWPLDEATGTAAFDASGSNRDGTLTNGPTLAADAYAPTGRACVLDGTDDYVAVADNSAFSSHAGASGVMTVEAWVKPTSFGSTRWIATKGNASNFEWALWLQSDGALRATMWTLAGSDVMSPGLVGPILPLNVWTHVAFTYDRAAPLGKLYVNGEVPTGQFTTTTGMSGTSGDGTARVLIGERDDSNSDPFAGSIAHVAVYPTALSAARIAAHYAASRGAASAPASYSDLILDTPGCVAYWPLTEPSGTSFADKRGGATGTSTGTVTAAGRSMGAYLGSVPDFGGGWIAVSDLARFTAAGTGAGSQLSVEAWIITDNAAADFAQVATKGNTAQYEWDLRTELTGTAVLISHNAAGSEVYKAVSAAGSIVAGRLIHLAGTYDRQAGSSSIYIDGVLVNTDSSVSGGGSMVDGTAVLQIGRRADGGTIWDGAIGHVAIYRRVLSAAEISSHNVAGRSGVHSLRTY